MEPPCEHGGVRSVLVTKATGVDLLQWSRRVNTAECAEVVELVTDDVVASMEPPCEHGGVLAEPGDESVIAALQWSRRVNTAE